MMSIKAYKGRVVPCSCKKEWTWMLDEKHLGCSESIGETRDFIGCINICCCDCIYSSNPQRAEYYKHCFPEEGKAVHPKLTREVFEREDCPEWAQWAAVDSDGKAYWYSKKPEPGVTMWRKITWNPVKFQQIENSIRTKFDASDWEHSLIERPQKYLPELTQTAFHCPDCPKEATKLKVFPANHVVALDKDDKVLSVMELQCQEGEVKKPEWLFSKAYNRLYRIDDYRQDIPEDAKPVHVQYFTPEELIGLAVKSHKTAKNYLIAAVNGLTVTLLGIEGKELLSMPTLVQLYSFTANRQPCCIIDFPQ